MKDSTNFEMNERPNAQPDSSIQARSPHVKSFSIHEIFIGADGLRAGWSLIIFAVLLAALLKGLMTIGEFMHLIPKDIATGAEISFRSGFFAECIPLFSVLLVTWIMSKIEKRPNSVYGLGGERRIPNFFAGMAWGVICLSLLVLTLSKTGLLQFDKRLLFGTEVLRYGLIWLVGFLLVGLLEEYLNRGYLLFTLTRGLAGIYSWLFKTRHSKALGFWTAALALSILFGLGHGKNPGESPIGLLSAGLGGLVFCLSLWRSGSLWWAIGFHTAWDWAQSFVYGVPDSGLMVQHHLFVTHPVGKVLLSGGTTGPEGSIFILPILALIVFIIAFTLPLSRRGDPRFVSAAKGVAKSFSN